MGEIKLVLRYFTREFEFNDSYEDGDKLDPRKGPARGLASVVAGDRPRILVTRKISPIASSGGRSGSEHK
jgi:hypothetical protein